MAPPGDILTLEVRPALFEDRDAVLGISDVIYEGLDYLPALYNTYLHDPNRNAIVGWIAGKAVAFHMFFLVDGGQTAVVQASRIDPDYLGSGLWSVFRKHQLLLLEDLPRVSTIAFTTAQKDLHIKRQLQGKTGSQLVMTQHTVSLIMDSNTEARLTQTALFDELNVTLPTLQQVRKLSRDDLYKALTNQSNQVRWFPNGHLIFMWEPFRLMDSNFELICAMDNIYAYSTCTDSAETTSTYQTLSLTTEIPTPGGTCFDIHFYGASVDDVVVHVYSSLRNWFSSRYTYSRAVPALHLPVGMDVECVQERLRMLLGVECGEVTSECLFESKVEEYETADRALLIAEGKIKVSTMD